MTSPLLPLALLFLRLGATAFGGPAAHIAMLEDEVVRRRRWLTHDEFLDLLGATNLIPGPNSTEMAMHIGYRQAGWPGLVVAGTCFILPATAIVMACAWMYVTFGTLPEATGLLYGVKPVIIAVVLQALWSLGRTAAKTRPLAVIALVAVLSNVCGVHELAVLFGGGGIMLVVRSWQLRGQSGAGYTTLRSLGIPLLATTMPVATGAVPYGIWPLFLFFLKIGAVMYGSGYVLLAFLRGDLVERWHWLTEAQLLDAIAVGQITPGPLFTTATFIGYVLAGPWAGVLCTAGIFLPGFVFVLLSNPYIPRLRRSPLTGAFLDGVNVSALALMAVVTWQLGHAALVDITTLALALASAILLLRFRVNSAWLVLGGAAAGLILRG